MNPTPSPARPGATQFPVWRQPIILAILTLFGLLAALLGEGAWRWLSWIAIGTPLAVIAWHVARASKPRRTGAAGTPPRP